MGIPVGNICAEIRSWGFFSRGDGDGGKSSPDNTLGRGLGKYPPSPWILRLRKYMLIYIFYILYNYIILQCIRKRRVIRSYRFVTHNQPLALDDIGIVVVN